MISSQTTTTNAAAAAAGFKFIFFFFPLLASPISTNGHTTSRRNISSYIVAFNDENCWPVQIAQLNVDGGRRRLFSSFLANAAATAALIFFGASLHTTYVTSSNGFVVGNAKEKRT